MGAQEKHPGSGLMELFADGIRWLADPMNWSGQNGIPARTLEHVQISLTAVLVAAALAIPVGLYIGHSGRGQFLAVSAANVGRALPSFGVLAIVFPFSLLYLPGSIGYAAILITMVLLAIPPILTNTYVGVQTVDRETVEAARGMGMTERQVLARLELPLAAPLIVAGLRTAAVQVVATATLGAFVGWGGLGRFLGLGFALGPTGRGGPILVGGAVLVAALAISTELTMGLLERTVAPRTTSTGRRLSPRRPGTAPKTA
jgi:osmoprotectant transport system permease protein